MDVFVIAVGAAVGIAIYLGLMWFLFRWMAR